MIKGKTEELRYEDVMKDGKLVELKVFLDIRENGKLISTRLLTKEEEREFIKRNK